MARTAQTARKSTDNNKIVDNPELDTEAAAKLKEIVEGSMQNLIKQIDKKFTKDGQPYYAETPLLEEDLPEQVNWWNKFAMCLVRHMDQENKRVLKTTLQINSQYLKDVLREAVPDYPGVSFQTKDIILEQPYHVLYHSRPRLQQAHDDSADEERQSHLQLLLKFIDDTFKEELDETKNLLAQGLISYKSLWCIMNPGSRIYTRVQRQPRVFILERYAYGLEGFSVFLKYVDFDGNDFGFRSQALVISPFKGTSRITGLSAFPIRFHPTSAKIQSLLTARGRKFEQYAGMHFCNYDGIALLDEDMGTSRYGVNGRVVVDTETAHRINAHSSFTVGTLNPSTVRQAHVVKDYDSSDDSDDSDESDYIDDDLLIVTDPAGDKKPKTFTPLTDEQCLLACDRVRGFSFTEKKWFYFFLDQLSPVEWNEECFNQLVLPSTQKDMVQALVSNHVRQHERFDDIVAGKGKGLVLVLHGPPGVGKTLTAETVAEYSQRPLYMVSSGDLGTNASTLDEQLRRIMDLASTWKAVLLIDEADVFLEARSLLDITRNSLVSIFLRELEYYQGIIFLTTNRVTTFDEAFKSRIHVPLKYPPLNALSRQRIWENFLRPAPVSSSGSAPDPVTVAVDAPGYARLAQPQLNGRQIKNIVRTARSLAQFRGVDLTVPLLEQVAAMQREFEDELDPGKTGEGGAMWL